MSDWTEKWRATHANFVKREKGVKSVLEHRFVDQGEIYLVAMSVGGFELRHYKDGKVKSATPFAKGTLALDAYRNLRNELVPNRTAKVAEEVKPKPKKKLPAKSKK